MSNVVAKELLDYIEGTLKDGFPEEDIKRTLVDAGWRKEDVIAAFVTVRGAKASPIGPPPITRTAEQKPISPASPAPAAGFRAPSLSAERPSGSGAYAPFPAASFSPKTADVILEKKPTETKVNLIPTSSATPVKSLSDLAAAKHRKQKTIVVTSIAAAVVLLFGGGTLFAYTQGYWPFAAPAPQDIANNTPPPPPEITDPIQAFRVAFSEQDYKVTLLGTLAFEQKTKSGTSTIEFTFTSDQFSAYQKGVPVLVVDDWMSVGMIEGRLTLLVPQAQKYSLIDDPKAHPQATAVILRELFNKASPVYNLIAPSSSPVVWEKVGEQEWLANFNATSSPISLPSRATATSTEVKIVLGQESHLIQAISIRVGGADAWQDIRVEYEIIPAIGDFLKIPPGYKQSDLLVIPG